MTSPDPSILKRAAAQRALGYVQDGVKLGLGTGTTAAAFVDLLGDRVREGLKVRCAATSTRTAARARALNIPVNDLDELAPLDLTIDGADEADRDFNLIKGGGGALLREKIVAVSSRRMIVIADGSKLVERLGHVPLPVEVIPFGQGSTAKRIATVLAGLGYQQAAMTQRMADDKPFVTDSGNVLYDLHLNAITDPELLALALGSVPGVVEHGLFIGIAQMLVIAHEDRVDVIERAAGG